MLLMSAQSVYPIRVGERADEVVGRFPDGRQLLLTTRFGPAARTDGEHSMLAQLIFDEEGAVLSSDVHSLGLAEGLTSDAVSAAITAALAALPPLETHPIQVQAIPTALLGEAFAPVTLTCEEEPDLTVSIVGDAVFIQTLLFDKD